MSMDHLKKFHLGDAPCYFDKQGCNPQNVCAYVCMEQVYKALSPQRIHYYV